MHYLSLSVFLNKGFNFQWTVSFNIKNFSISNIAGVYYLSIMFWFRENDVRYVYI